MVVDVVSLYVNIRCREVNRRPNYIVDAIVRQNVLGDAAIIGSRKASLEHSAE
jgi:hypothetical protein